MPHFTPDNPMYPDVCVDPTACAEGPFYLIAAVSNALRSRHGHDAANRFENEAVQCWALADLMEFVRRTVRVS